MKPNPDETYESWCNRVKMYEQGRALMEIAQGKDPEQVIGSMSRRLTAKLLHPIYKALQNDELKKI